MTVEETINGQNDDVMQIAQKIVADPDLKEFFTMLVDMPEMDLHFMKVVMAYIKSKEERKESK